MFQHAKPFSTKSEGNSFPKSLAELLAGVIFIDRESIPNSDILTYFPYIFKAKRPKNLPRYVGFVQKIIEMGMIDLIFKSKRAHYKEIKTTSENHTNWWFIG